MSGIKHFNVDILFAPRIIQETVLQFTSRLTFGDASLMFYLVVLLYYYMVVSMTFIISTF